MAIAYGEDLEKKEGKQQNAARLPVSTDFHALRDDLTAMQLRAWLAAGLLLCTFSVVRFVTVAFATASFQWLTD